MKAKAAVKSTALAVRVRRLPRKPAFKKNIPAYASETVPVAFHEGIQLLPVEQQTAALMEYDLRRNNFLKWLFSHIVEGIHYGYPPGCESKYDTEGNMIGRDGGRITPKQWLSRPSLYKSGAQLIVDLLHLQPLYESDMDAWHMMGDPKGVVVRKCTLSAMGKRLGEGTGAFEVGKKGMDQNSSIKMGDKRALVAAVFNAVPVIGELFTQDIEEKLAERKKGDVNNLRNELVRRVEGLVVGKSKWQGEVSEFIRKATVNLFGPGQRLTTVDKVVQFNQALDTNRIDLDTAAIRN